MSEPLLAVSGLVKRFPLRHGVVQAVREVSFTIAAGETIGLVGESGCGKSTLGKTVMRLLEPDGGSIRLAGQEIADLGRAALRPHRRLMQMVFQDPYGSLNPRKAVGTIIEEPMIVHRLGNAAERKERVAWLMGRVGMRPETADRYPHEFSGGQRQRIGLARALSLNPKLIICDEPVSSLDVSVQAQVINLLAEIQAEFKLSLLFISHDLSVVAHVSDRVMVMYLGRIVEVASRKAIWTNALHPYTRALLSAVPVPDPDWTERRQRIILEGDLPSPADPPSGCGFHTRCPFAVERCRAEEPVLRPWGRDGRQVACHLVSAGADGEPVAP